MQQATEKKDTPTAKEAGRRKSKKVAVAEGAAQRLAHPAVMPRVRLEPKKGTRR
jgi:hypothetical protein